jgi:hypothetical protein
MLSPRFSSPISASQQKNTKDTKKDSLLKKKQSCKVFTQITTEDIAKLGPIIIRAAIEQSQKKR